MLVWTEGYSPFIMGGDVNAPIGADIEVGEKIPLGKGIFGYLVASPISGETFVAEAETGAFVGPTIERVRADIEAADEDVMADQIVAAKERLKKVRTLDAHEFWSRFRKKEKK